MSSGQEHTVAFDWALVSFEAIDDDLGQLVFGAEMNLKEVPPAAIDQALFESYLDGLRDSGCPLDPRLVRFGYTTSSALRIGLFSLFLITKRLKQGQGDAGIAAEPARPFEVRMAGEAYRLMDSIS